VKIQNVRKKTDKSHRDKEEKENLYCGKNNAPTMTQ